MAKKNYHHSMQTEKYDCGFSCILNILHYYNTNIDVERMDMLFEKLDSGLNGATIKDVLSLYGLQTKAIKIEPDDIDLAIEKYNKPVILHTNNYHYVVCYGIKKGKLIISDPAKSKITYENISDYAKELTGMVLIPTSDNESYIYSPKGFGLVNTFVIDELKRNKKQLILIYFVSIISMLLGAYSSFVFKAIIDFAIPTKALNILWSIISTFIAVYISINIANYIRGRLVIKLSFNIDRALADEYFNKTLKLPLSFFKDKDQGEVISRFNDISSLRGLISNDLILSIVDVSLIMILALILYFQNKLLFLISVLPIVIYLSISYLFYSILNKENKDAMEEYAKTTNIMINSVKGLQYIKTLNIEPYILSKTSSVFNRFLNSSVKLSKTMNLNQCLIGLVKSIFTLIIIGAGSLQIIYDVYNIGSLITFTTLLGAFMTSLERIISLQSSIQKAEVATKRYLQIINFPEEKELEDINENIEKITINNLDYSYNMKAKLFENVSFEIGKGEMISISGKSGIGKSTLAKLISKINACDRNMIFINDKDISGINSKSLRSKIILLSQSSIFIKGTIRENLCMGGEYSDTEIINACKFANIHSDIENFEKMYEYIVEDDGVNLSAGQRQRIALARVILRNPDVLILDEFNSNIDVENNKIIMNGLKELECIKILITHNEDDHEYADKLYEVSDKNIILKQEVMCQL